MGAKSGRVSVVVCVHWRGPIIQLLIVPVSAAVCLESSPLALLPSLVSVQRSSPVHLSTCVVSWTNFVFAFLQQSQWAARSLPVSSGTSRTPPEIKCLRKRLTAFSRQPPCWLLLRLLLLLLLLLSCLWNFGCRHWHFRCPASPQICVLAFCHGATIA
jgi:hypothetical protein